MIHYSEILRKIKQINAEKLPGFAAQSQMSPPYRTKLTLNEVKSYQPKDSAVLILIYEKNGEPYIVLTERQAYNGVHSKQISLPGGRYEPQDETFVHTALRETYEEIGVHVTPNDIIAALTWLYIPPSNFLVYPYIAVTENSPKFVREETEVKTILEVPITDFLHNKNKEYFEYVVDKMNLTIECPCYNVNGYKVWGATAMILSEFFTILEK